MTIDVPKCPRCGLAHTQVEFRQFTRPIIDNGNLTWTHWASCPENGDPILMQQLEIWNADEAEAQPSP